MNKPISTSQLKMIFNKRCHVIPHSMKQLPPYSHEKMKIIKIIQIINKQE